MDRITRKGLKHDRFAEEVQHSVEYVGEHRSQFVLYGAIAAAVVVIGVGAYFYMQRQHAQRQEELKEALKIQDAAVGPGQSEFVKTFPTQADKEKAAIKAFSDLASKYPSKDEGVVGGYYLGIVYADQGKLIDAEREFQKVIASGNKPYGSLARLSLAQICQSMGKTADAEKQLRYLVDNPTVLVSKEQATIALAKLIAPTRLDEANKLLDPLKKERAAVSRLAITAAGELSLKK